MSLYDNNRGSRPCDRRAGRPEYRPVRPEEADIFDLKRKLECECGISLTNISGDGCRGPMIGAPSLAMVYCPRQSWRGLLTPADALCKGSLFSELVKPLLGDGRR